MWPECLSIAEGLVGCLAAHRLVVGLRRWLDTRGGGGPTAGDPGPVEGRREVLLDRLHQHTEKCPSCMAVRLAECNMQTSIVLACNVKPSYQKEEYMLVSDSTCCWIWLSDEPREGAAARRRRGRVRAHQAQCACRALCVHRLRARRQALKRLGGRWLPTAGVFACVRLLAVRALCAGWLGDALMMLPLLAPASPMQRGPCSPDAGGLLIDVAQELCFGDVQCSHV